MLDRLEASREGGEVIRRVIEHNQLNGVALSVVEFLLVVAAAAFIGIGLGLHHRWIGAALAAGTVLNCLVVIGDGVAAWRRGERGASLRRLFHAQYREEVSRNHPTLMRDTMILAAAAVVPYALLIAVVSEHLVDLVPEAQRPARSTILSDVAIRERRC